MKWIKLVLGPIALGALCSCAVMHRTTIGERLEASADTRAVEVDVATGAIGVDKEAVNSGFGHALRNRGSSTGDSLAAFASFLVWATSQSPRTGDPTMTDDWAEAATERLRAQCRGGALTGIQVVRESARYPYVSGEIVRAKGQCLLPRKEESKHASL